MQNKKKKWQIKEKRALGTARRKIRESSGSWTDKHAIVAKDKAEAHRWHTVGINSSLLVRTRFPDESLAIAPLRNPSQAAGSHVSKPGHTPLRPCGFAVWQVAA